MNMNIVFRMPPNDQDGCGSKHEIDRRNIDLYTFTEIGQCRVRRCCFSGSTIFTLEET